MNATYYVPQTQEQRDAVREASAAQDAAELALQAFADALYREALLVKGEEPLDADLKVRAILSRMGEELAHDWAFSEPEA